MNAPQDRHERRSFLSAVPGIFRNLAFRLHALTSLLKSTRTAVGFRNGCCGLFLFRGVFIIFANVIKLLRYMGIHRATRFLIDSIDAKLGDVDKEIQMDKSVIAISVFFLVLEAILIPLAVMYEGNKYLAAGAVIGGFFAIIFLYVLVTMIEELISDIHKKKNASK